ncbi:MAG: hypothetical protein KKB02_12230 [Alphaproteobacteria bacterium]|nr:hypothetical protein [Alphaproteobacteria bacterium]
MKRFLIALTVIVGIVLMVTSKSRLERDAEALAEVISERIICNVTPIYRGFDAISGFYDFNRQDQRKFKEAYEHYYAAASIRLSALTIEQQKLLCADVELFDEHDVRRIID